MLLSAVLPGAPAIEFSSVSYDSRAVQPGAVFVAIPRVPLDKPAGNHRDGHDYVAGALAAGAVAAVVEHPVDAAIPQMRVPSSRLALAELAAAVCGHPAEALRLIGVTGTDGKTTTVRLVSQLLEASGRRTGFATTTDFKVAGRQWENLSRETTIEAPDLQQLLRDMVAGGCGWAVLEATSQGLEQERLHGCRFHVAAFTNVTSDHLDWHKTMENYRAAKRRLFANLRPDGVAVLNGDDPTSAFFAEVVPGRVMTFGLAGQGNVLAENVRYEENGIAFDLHFDGSARAVVLPLLGRFNVQNALAAAGVGLAEGLSLDEVATGLAQARAAPGRMESIEAGQSFRVLVDYAHTAHAFACVLTEGRAMADSLGSRLLVVFGCSGERDRAKRPAMGATAARLANFFVLTDEDPHSEDPRDIVREIEAGAGGGNYVVEMDRRAALARAFREAQPRDVVLVTGKGHERSMIVAGDRRNPWDERGIVRQELERL